QPSIPNLPLTLVASLRDHPLGSMVPEMRPPEWRAFLEDIRQSGVLEPIRVAPDGRTVLDGRHRLRAARELGLDAVPTAPALCEAGGESAYMLRAALHRRHLSDDQRAMLAVHLAEAISAERRRERAQGAARARWTGGEEAPAAPDACGTGAVQQASPLPFSREIAAAFLGVSERRLRMAQVSHIDNPPTWRPRLAPAGCPCSWPKRRPSAVRPSPRSQPSRRPSSPMAPRYGRVTF
ncbi:transcriptional regulator, partial [mine drainage metagenome]